MRRMLLLAALLVGAAPARVPHEYTLTNAHGMTVRFLDYGATITAIDVPQRNGSPVDVVLGYRTPADYVALNGKNGFGATIGRYAGRIGQARFAIDGHEYHLQPNDGPNALHGGKVPGLQARFFTVTTSGRDAGTLRYVSPDGDQGFPGQLTVTVRYRLQPDDTLRIDYSATTTKPTVFNITNHSYFNLAGGGPVTPELLQIDAKRWMATDAHGIPDGKLPPVAGTPLDFRTPQRIGDRIDSPAMPAPGPHGGYNHGWAFDKPLGKFAPVIRLVDPASRRRLTIATTEPSLIAYTGDYIDGKDTDAKGRTIHPRDGIALETEHFADSPNRPEFPSTILRPGQVYRATTTWRFDTVPK